MTQNGPSPAQSLRCEKKRGKEYGEHCKEAHGHIDNGENAPKKSIDPCVVSSMWRVHMVLNT